MLRRDPKYPKLRKEYPRYPSRIEAVPERLSYWSNEEFTELIEWTDYPIPPVLEQTLDDEHFKQFLLAYGEAEKQAFDAFRLATILSLFTNTDEEIGDAMSVILCTAGYDHSIRFWEALSGLCSRTIQHPESQVNRLCISPDKRWLAVAGHENVKIFDIIPRTPTTNNQRDNPLAPALTFNGHSGNITGVAFHIETKWMVTSSEDGTIKIWDTRTASIQRNYSHGSPVNDVVIHPNQGELISCDRAGNVRIWDLGENRCTHQLEPEEGAGVQSVTVATDGSLLCAGTTTGNVYVWRMLQHHDTTSLIPVTSFQAHSSYILRVLLSPDVRHLATCSADHNARIWAVTDANSTSPTTSAKPTASQATANPNLNPSSSSSPNYLPTPPELRKERPATAFPLEANLGAHQRWVWDCAFSADSAYLVTACSDHYARLWELSTQTIIRQYNGHHRGAVCVALNDYSEAR